jgi:hypothetical protein
MRMSIPSEWHSLESGTRLSSFRVVAPRSLRLTLEASRPSRKKSVWRETCTLIVALSTDSRLSLVANPRKNPVRKQAWSELMRTSSRVQDKNKLLHKREQKTLREERNHKRIIRGYEKRRGSQHCEEDGEGRGYGSRSSRRGHWRCGGGGGYQDDLGT